MKAIRANTWRCSDCDRKVVLNLITKDFVVLKKGNEKFPHEIPPEDYLPLYEFPQEVDPDYWDRYNGEKYG
jgi:hypothetical protein